MRDGGKSRHEKLQQVKTVRLIRPLVKFPNMNSYGLVFSERYAEEVRSKNGILVDKGSDLLVVTISRKAVIVQLPDGVKVRLTRENYEVL